MDTTPTQEQLDLAKPIDTLVAEWQQTKEYLDKAKAREIYLRKLVADRIFINARTASGHLPEGTTRQSIAGVNNNFAGKVSCPYKREIDEALFAPTVQEAQLTADEYAACFKLDPQLKMAGYNALPTEKRAILDKMIVAKPGSITLEVQTLPK